LAREGGNIKKRGFAPLKHPVPFYLSGLVLVEGDIRAEKRGIGYKLT